MALIDQDSESNATVQQQGGSGSSGGGGAAPALRDGTSGGTDSSSGQQGGQQKRGQEALKKDNQQASRYVDVVKDQTRVAHSTEVQLIQGGNTLVSVSGGNVYLGGKAGDAGMLKVMVQGELWSKNVYAMSGGGAEPPDRVAAATALERLMARVDELTARIEALEARP